MLRWIEIHKFLDYHYYSMANNNHSTASNVLC